MRKSILLFFVVLATPALLPAVGINQTFDFTGQCFDCAGTVTAELVLVPDYALGTTITTANFESFTYDGSNLLAPFTITLAEVTSISGTMPTDLPSTANIDLSSAAHNFSSMTDGNWVVDFHEDQGMSHVWTAAASAPEPDAFSMMGLGFLLAFARRRWKKVR
jgi:hypothetical protein